MKLYRYEKSYGFFSDENGRAKTEISIKLFELEVKRETNDFYVVDYKDTENRISKQQSIFAQRDKEAALSVFIDKLRYINKTSVQKIKDNEQAEKMAMDMLLKGIPE